MSDGNRHLVEPPGTAPYRFGLLSVVDPRLDDDPHWRQGVQWESQACSDIGATTYPCLDPEPVDPLDVDDSCEIVDWEPFTLYSFPRQPLVGRTDADALANARERLQLGEQHGAEEVLWGLMSAAATPVDVSAAGDVGYALGYVEQALANEYGSRGVIHVNRITATLLFGVGYLRVEGGQLVTGLGTPLVAGGGYETDLTTPPTTLTIIGTGPVVMYRGGVTEAVGYDRETNVSTIIAQRDYLLGWDCTTVAATAPVPNSIPEV